MGAPSLIHTPGEVTADWLTSVLGQAGALANGARVVSFESEPIGTGQMADTVRFTLTFDARGSGPASVVGKFASADDQSRATGLALRAYEVEVRFYREVAARVAARVPGTYVCEVEPETGWFTLLLEDVVGASQGDQIEACDVDTAAAVLEEMAGLHAPCWDSPDLGALEWLNRESPESDQLLAALMSSLAPGFLERYADTMAPEHQEVCRIFAERLSLWGELRRSGPRTASHGDFRLDNLLFQPGNPRPVVVDWQTVTWSGGSGDVAYFIGGCLSAKDRRANEEDLLAHYHDALCRHGVRGYTLEQLQADVQRDTFFGIRIGMLASMLVQRTERGDLMFLTSVSRHAQHVLDSDALALLRADG
ncbi:MAG TPA: aminoglycoside phosphotransferase family protein [Acidimicrobiales bacterium]|nr:aminoglycoside phosphotransferase family protein [Acidimicrobiales bacterium]